MKLLLIFDFSFFVSYVLYGCFLKKYNNAIIVDTKNNC